MFLPKNPYFRWCNLSGGRGNEHGLHSSLEHGSKEIVQIKNVLHEVQVGTVLTGGDHCRVLNKTNRRRFALLKD